MNSFWKKEIEQDKVIKYLLFDEMSIHFLLGDITSLSFKNKYKNYYYIVRDKKCSLFF